MALTDNFGRQITDLRVSITDRCNFRCVYCRSGENDIPGAERLSFDEYERLVRILVGLGIRKVRVTGGEPLVRPGVAEFLGRLKALGVRDLSLTTNGFTLAERLDSLVASGLDRINISLDSLKPKRFEAITRTKTFDQVMASIEAAQASKLRPVKINAVLVRGLNDDEVEDFAQFARDLNLIMRFIEFMPLDAGHTWTRDRVVTAAEIHERISARWPLVPIEHERSETARRYRFADGCGEIGLVAPVTQPFCGHCSRIRLTADGKLRTCLFSKEDHDLKFLLHGGASDGDIANEIRAIVAQKEKGHRINEPDFVPPARSMVFIGG
ncbi:MAG TPA: GTP 3',8-cyclase MoaA [Candidatus Binatia bacterium]|nr:GTP 3',8-cyclase MoaA [Candidatus Binatia bacterium]